MQQINLYQAQFKPKQVVLPPRQMLLIISIVVLMLAVMSLYSAQRNSNLEHIVSKQQHTVQAIDLTIKAPQLDLEFDKLQAQYEHNQRLLDYLAHHDFGNQHGFSASLKNLADHRTNNVWLTSFSFFSGGKVISLKGRALNSSDIPSYLNNLSSAQGFQGKKFSVFQLEQPEDDTGFYSFQLHTDSNYGK